jgi:hypothetical protein
VIFQRMAGGRETSTVYDELPAFLTAWTEVSGNPLVHFAEAFLVKLAVPVATRTTHQTTDKLQLEPEKPPPRIAGNGSEGPYR